MMSIHYLFHSKSNPIPIEAVFLLVPWYLFIWRGCLCVFCRGVCERESGHIHLFCSVCSCVVSYHPPFSFPSSSPLFPPLFPPFLLPSSSPFQFLRRRRSPINHQPNSHSHFQNSTIRLLSVLQIRDGRSRMRLGRARRIGRLLSSLLRRFVAFL